MKLKISELLALLGTFTMLAMLAWVYTLHGTRGLLYVEYIAWIALVLVAVIGVVPLLLVVIGRLRERKPAKSRIGIGILGAVWIIVPILVFLFLNGRFTPAFETAPRLMILSNKGDHGLPDMVVAFESRLNARYTLTWGTIGEFKISEDEPGTSHAFILSGLEPGTEYHYRINEGPQFSFTTPDLTQPLHFAVVSDGHFGAGDSRPDISRQILGQIADPADSFNYLFSLGDNVEWGFMRGQWQEAFDNYASTVSTIPTGFTVGNHDALFTGLNYYLDYFYPEALRQNGTNSLWHRFDVGNIHFIVLDVEWSAETLTKQQLDWLEQELKSIPSSDWTIVLNHGYYYSSGTTTRGWDWFDDQETIRLATPFFEKYGVDIVFSGHAHQMELLQKAGVTYVIGGTFGGVLDDARTYISPASQWYESGQYGFVDVKIDNNQAVVSFVDPDGKLLKTTTLTK
jgi:acid phosphatase type 7